MHGERQHKVHSVYGRTLNKLHVDSALVCERKSTGTISTRHVVLLQIISCVLCREIFKTLSLAPVGTGGPEQRPATAAFLRMAEMIFAQLISEQEQQSQYRILQRTLCPSTSTTTSPRCRPYFRIGSIAAASAFLRASDCSMRSCS